MPEEQQSTDLPESHWKLPWWEDCIWWLYSFMPPAIDNLRKKIAPAIALARDLRVPLFLFRGSSLAKTDSAVIVAGNVRWAYGIARRFFSTEPTRQSLGSVPFYRLSKTLREWSPRIDLVVALVDRTTAGLLGPDYLTLPGLYSLIAPVPESLDKLNRMNPYVREDVRRVRSRSYGFEVTSINQGFHEFYDRYHMPLIRNRHGTKAFFYNRYLLRRMVRHGGILWITRDGQRVAACAFEKRNGIIDLVANGTLDGRTEILRQGALAASYYYGIYYAMQQGCTHIEFGGAAPFLNDGLFQYKRKWQPRIAAGQCAASLTLIHWPRQNEAVVKFLADTSLIVCDGDQLSAITVLNGPEPGTVDKAAKLFSLQGIEGLRRFWVISPAGWQSTETTRMLGQTELKMVQTVQSGQLRSESDT